MFKIKIIFKIILITVLFTSNSFGSNPPAKDVEVKNLVTEYKSNPIGIDVEKPRLSWKIVSTEKNIIQTAYQIQAAKSKEDLKKGKDLLWDSKKVSSDQSIQLIYEGNKIASGQRVYWRVKVWTNKSTTKWSAGDDFWQKGIKTSEWQAKWISPKQLADSNTVEPNPYLRKGFKLSKKIKSATLSVTALGLYEIFINGEKLSNDLFSPGWTSYKKRLQYQTYDVTAMLTTGKNAIGAILAEGWYKGNLVWENYRNIYGDRLALLSQLKVEYTDGTSELIVSDKSWKKSTGAYLYTSIYHGLLYNSNLEQDKWSTNSFDASKWEAVEEIEHSKDILIAQSAPTVKEIQQVKPLKIFTDSKGNVIYDMGQNMVGYVQITVDGKKGQKITLRHAEVLDKDKNFFTLNLRSAKATTEFILKGGKEILKPKFTFQGFRYVQVEGLKNPKLENITGIVVHSDIKQTGTFKCSDNLINQLQSNIQWSQKGNFLDVPTDCPQRDERLGWTGDIQAFSPTAAYNMDVAGFLTKWLRDLSADQYETGSVPHIIPDVLKGSAWKNAAGSTGWGDAAVVVPWTLYQAYGDKRILEQQYESMKAWVDYESSQADEDGVWRFGTGFEGTLVHFGDWLSYSTETAEFPGATTDKDLIATAYYAYSSNTLSKIAATLGKNEDEIKYKAQYKKIKKAFKNEFITLSGRLSSNTQTAYVLSLSFGLIPDELIESSAAYLAKDLEHLRHLTTGFLGTPLLMQTLSDAGYEDLAFMLLNRKVYPSWLYPVTVGATTIWERWDSQRPDGSFNGDTMNSFNHYAYGAVGSWLYNYVAGIRIDENRPGYKRIIIKPTIGGGLTFASSTHESMYGTISSSWKIEDGKVITQVEIPANTTAVVYAPNKKGDYEMHEVGSGKYTFVK